jgi:hypothetical protein
MNDPLGCSPKASPRLWAASLVFSLSLIASTWMQKVMALGRVSGLAVAVLPAAGCAYLLFEEVRYMRRLDELQKQIQLEALAIGFPGAMVLLVLIGFLHYGGFLAAKMDLRNLWLLAPFCYLVGLLIARKRYQ